MLKVDQYEYIRTAHRVYGKTIRQIARDIGHSKNTVKKALRSQMTGYSVRVRQPHPVLGPYLQIIDRWLTADRQSPRKQRHTARRIYHRLQSEHGYKGSEKAVRRNYMVPVPRAASLSQLNSSLLEQCLAFGRLRITGRSQTVSELFEQEKRHLIALLPVPYQNVETSAGKIDKYSTVIVDKNRYSAPTTYAGLRIQTLVYTDRVEIFHNGKKIAAHRRVYGNNKWQLDTQNYLELIYHRPQAFESARPIRQWRAQWPDCLEALLSRFNARRGETKGVKLLFQVLAEHHGRKPVIITSNMGFGDWTQIFGEPTLTAALLDRITHKSHIINSSWESYRLKDTLSKKKGKDPDGPSKGSK